MTQAIRRLKIDRFRGATSEITISFDRRKPSVLIFGENATGKSTIVDAIDFVGNKSIGSLRHRSLDGAMKIHSLRSFGTSSADVAVTVETDGGSWTGRVVSNQIRQTGPDGCPRIAVLRRPELGQLMEAQPADRYAILQRFVGVEAVERAESVLDQLIQRWVNASTSSSSQAQNKLDVLGGIAEAAGQSPGDLVEWCRAQLDTSIADIQSEQQKCSAAKELLTTSKTALENLQRVQLSHANAVAALEKLESEIRDSGTAQDGADDLVLLIEQAQAYVAKFPSEACPVCLQPVQPTELVKSLVERLQSMQALLELLRARAKAVSSLQAQQHLLATARTEAILALDSLMKDERFDQECQTAEREVMENREDVLCAPQNAVVCSDAIIGRLTAQIASRSSQIDRRAQITRHLSEFDSSMEAAEHANVLQETAKVVLGTLRACRAEFTGEILRQIEEEADRLYELIHPGEELGCSRLSLVRNHSIEQTATFCGEEVRPGAYYSESHLDTLGFCVWVAVAKLEQPESTIVVLDDVFTSVDLEHLGRLTGVIDDMVGTFAQVIIVTHSRRWLDHYRYRQGGGAALDLRQLLNYAPAVGVRLVDTSLPTIELEQLLMEEPPSREKIAGTAGVILESVLDRLCLQYRRRLPRQPDSAWTLGDLLAATRRLLAQLQLELHAPAGEVCPVLKTPAEAAAALLDDHGPLIIVRNRVGAHFNRAGSEIPEREVLLFGSTVRDLAVSLCCPWCGTIPEKRDGDAFRCGCRASRLRPLEATV